MLVYLGALIAYIVSVIAFVTLHELFLRLIPASLVKLARFGNEVIITSILFLAYFSNFIQSCLDDWYFFPQRVDFDHIFEAPSETIVVVLGVWTVHGRIIEVEFYIFFIEFEEFFFDLILVWLFFSFFF